MEGPEDYTHIAKLLEGAEDWFLVSPTAPEGAEDYTHIAKLLEGAEDYTQIAKLLEGAEDYTHIAKLLEGAEDYTDIAKLLEGTEDYTHIAKLLEGAEDWFLVPPTAPERLDRHNTEHLKWKNAVTAITWCTYLNKENCIYFMSAQHS